MKIETLEHLVNWSSTVHEQLAEQLETAARGAGDSPARLFIDYAVTHERKMAQQVAGLIRESDAKALQTWVYDWLEHLPKRPEAIIRVGDHEVNLEAVSRTLFTAHNEIMAVFHQLEARADTSELEELIARVIDIEEGHTRQMAQQLNRTRDM